MRTRTQIDADNAAMNQRSRGATAVAEPVEKVPNCISDHETYRPSEIKRRIGLGRDWLRAARRMGLKVVGKKPILVDGRDLREHLRKYPVGE